MGQYVTALKEANLAAMAKLEEAREDLARTEKSVDTLIKSATESESDRQEALVELERMKRALDIEIIRLLRRREEREGLKVEKTLL